MVEDHSLQGKERRYASRRLNRGRVTKSTAETSASPAEVIRSLPATSADSPISHRRWISPQTAAAERLSAVVAEAKRKEQETTSSVESASIDSPCDSLPQTTEQTTKPQAIETQIISTIAEEQGKDSIAEMEPLLSIGENEPEAETEDTDIEAAITALDNAKSQPEVEAPPAIFETISEPLTITDTQSALTATQVKAEIRRQKKLRRRRRRLIFTLVLIILLGLLGGGVYAGIKYSPEFASLFGISNEYEGKGNGEVLVTIPKGANGTQIAEILVKNDVIAGVDGFIEAYKKNQYAQGIQPGVYKMAKQMSAKEALARLLDPKYKVDKKLTIPEGFKVEQIKERIIKTTDFKPKDVESAFIKATKEYLPAEAKGHLEGWIAPDTYILQKEDTAEQLLKKMIDTQLMRLKKLGVKPEQYQIVLIKASILEREVSKPDDLGKVARVIENRLKQDGPTSGLLQMCSTVVYGLGKDIIIPSDEELKVDTPYNTYMHPGLPPYPIGSPGQAAIKAILNPTPGDWVYFATVNLQTGETRFAKTKEEHDKNVAELREYCNKNPKICKKNG